LPVVFICENNGYAISVPLAKESAVEHIALHAHSYGFPGVIVDGNDPLDVYAATHAAMSRARHGEGPTLVECKTYRYLAHTSDDERVMVLGEDVGPRGGVFRATDGLFDEFGEARVLDTPLAESGIVGVAIGLALAGLRPVAEIQFADFIHAAFDQLVSEAAKIHYRSNGDFEVPLVVRAPWGGGVHGALYHSQSIEAFYAHVAGLKVVAP